VNVFSERIVTDTVWKNLESNIVDFINIKRFKTSLFSYDLTRCVHFKLSITVLSLIFSMFLVSSYLYHCIVAVYCTNSVLCSMLVATAGPLLLLSISVCWMKHGCYELNKLYGVSTRQRINRERGPMFDFLWLASVFTAWMTGRMSCL